MRIGDQILITGKQVTPIKSTNSNTLKRSINSLRLMNRNSNHQPQVSILASKSLPDNSILYLVSIPRSSSPPRWQERSKIIQTYKEAIQKFERKQKSFLSTQHTTPQIENIESSQKLSSQEQSNNGQLNGKRKFCIGGKTPYGMLSPTKKLQSETLQQAMKQGYITKNSFKSNNPTQPPKQQLFYDYSTAASSCSDKKTKKCNDKKESKQIQQQEIIKENSNGFSDIENVSHMLSQNDKQQDNNQQDNQSKEITNHGIQENFKKDCLLTSKKNQDLVIISKQDFSLSENRNHNENAKTTFNLGVSSENEKAKEIIADMFKKLSQDLSNHKAEIKHNSQTIGEQQVSHVEQNTNAETLENTTSSDVQQQKTITNSSLIEDNNQTNEVEEETKIIESELQEVQQQQLVCDSNKTEIQLEKSSIVVVENQTNPSIETTKDLLNPSVTPQQDIQRIISEEENKQPLEEDKKQQTCSVDSVPEVLQPQEEEENKPVPSLIGLEKSKSQKVEALSSLLKQIFSNGKEKDNSNQASELQQEQSKQNIGESHQEEEKEEENNKQEEEKQPQNNPIIEELPIQGDFTYGDKAKRIAACRPKENDILMDIEWEPRINGDIPEKTTVSSKSVRTFDSDLLIDFYESKIKFTYNSNEKKKIQQQSTTIKKEDQQ